MSRAVGAMERLATVLEPVEPLLALLTQLGDVWFLVVLAVGLYWLGDRVPLAGWTPRHGSLVIAGALLAFALTHVLKGAFAVPRPPGAGVTVYAIDGPLGALYGQAATATGYGFPSGHAVGAAAVYGTIGLSNRDVARPRRLSLAAGVIALVCLTRLGLGVHYLVDVFVGVAIGLGVAAVAIRLGDQPEFLFGLAVVAAVVSGLVGGVDPQSAALLGGTGGALAAWWLVRPLEAAPVGTSPGSATAVVLSGGASLAVAVALVAGGAVTGSAGFASLGVGLLVVAYPASRRDAEE